MHAWMGLRAREEESSLLGWQWFQLRRYVDRDRFVVITSHLFCRIIHIDAESKLSREELVRIEVSEVRSVHLVALAEGRLPGADGVAVIVLADVEVRKPPVDAVVLRLARLRRVSVRRLDT